MAKLTNLWVYNVAIYHGKPHLLLGERKGSEGKFWHLPCGTILGDFNPRDESEVTGKALANAKTATRQEAGLDITSARLTMVHYDPTAASSWNPSVHCAHVLADLGAVRKLLDITPQLVTYGKGEDQRVRGLTKAMWMPLNELIIAPRPVPNKSREPSASPHISCDGMFLRSMVATVLSRDVLPVVIQRFGPLRLQPGFLSPRLRHFREHHHQQ